MSHNSVGWPLGHVEWGIMRNDKSSSTSKQWMKLWTTKAVRKYSTNHKRWRKDWVNFGLFSHQNLNNRKPSVIRLHRPLLQRIFLPATVNFDLWPWFTNHLDKVKMNHANLVKKVISFTNYYPDTGTRHTHTHTHTCYCYCITHTCTTLLYSPKSETTTFDYKYSHLQNTWTNLHDFGIFQRCFVTNTSASSITPGCNTKLRHLAISLSTTAMEISS